MMCCWGLGPTPKLLSDNLPCLKHGMDTFHLFVSNISGFGLYCSKSWDLPFVGRCVVHHLRRP